jgi:hypothetical protein
MENTYAKFEKYLEYYDLCEEGKASLKEAAKKICEDENLTAKAISIKTKLADLALDINFDEEFKDTSPGFGAFAFTLAIEDTEKLYEQKNIPREVLLDTIQDLGVWIRRSREWTGEWGFSQYGWLILHLRAKIFKLGRLQFEPQKIKTPPPANLGLNLKEGDPYLNVHIPRGQKLDEEACLDSFERAKRFFPEVLGYDFFAFGCFTWLFDPAFKELLPPDSNILKFQKMFVLLPAEEGYWGLDYVFVNITRENIKDAPTDTYFRKKLVEPLFAGGKMHSAGGYRIN